MPTYALEINTDAGDREAGLQYVVAQENAAITARNNALPEGAEPELLLDAKQYLQKNFDPVIDSYAAYFVSKAGDDLKDKFSRADQTTRDQVVTILAQFQPAAFPAALEAASVKVA